MRKKDGKLDNSLNPISINRKKKYLNFLSKFFTLMNLLRGQSFKNPLSVIIIFKLH